MASLVPTISALSTAAVAAGCVAAGLTFASVSVVPAGNVGVVDMFGKVRNDVLQPGFHILNPLARLGQTHKNTNASLSQLDTQCALFEAHHVCRECRMRRQGSQDEHQDTTSRLQGQGTNT